MKVPEDSKFPLLGVRVSSSHLPQSGVATLWEGETKEKSKESMGIKGPWSKDNDVRSVCAPKKCFT
jgi:hypothetical protein